ncbi:hAT family C-terminal dimerization region [Phytophthora infestans]|uniref:HAT family C-terminal dimerization region n=1 Tax=Phytophthora infestans TaxID=4787 RepID=A0A8S9TJR5_PHYIN|nr:hAT family C-terminal dimerization region [Phytophthora infestans]
MGRKEEPIWAEFAVSRSKSETKQHPDVYCKHCNEVIMNAQPGRHLYPHIKYCGEASAQTKTKYGEVVAEKKRKAHLRSTADFVSPTKARRTSYSGSARQTPTKYDVNKTEEKEMHLDIARAFYTSGIPFRVIENADMRRALTRFRPSMKLPTRQSLATTLLDQVYTTEKTRLAALLQRQKRLTLVTDGWSNVNRESIINYVLSSPTMRPMMWSSEATGTEAHTGEYMASEISRVITEAEAVAGVGKVTAVVSDNAANMKKAGKLVELKHPDIFKIDFFASTLKKAVKIVKFVRARHLLLGRIRAERGQVKKCVKAGELSTPVSTRWYAQEKCIKSVVRNKVSLTAAFNDPELMKHYTDKVTTNKLNVVREILEDDQFWTNAKLILRLTKPITRVLAAFETDSCSNSMILHEFDRLKNAQEFNTSAAGLTSLSVRERIVKLVDERWKFISPPSNVTAIAHLMDLSQQTSVFKGNSLRDTVADAVALAERFGLPPEQSSADFRSLLLNFVALKKSWSAGQREEASADPPLHWWLLDEDFCNLHAFAERVLSIPTSSAASERLWSTQGFTHTKLRNRLRVATVEKLSFI